MEEDDLAQNNLGMEQDQQPSSSSEEDLLSDDDHVADDAQQKELLQKLEADVSSNPYNYQAHVEYITVLRKCGLLEELRSAREAMNVLFPFSPEMWQQWTEDEARLISSDEDIASLEKLYERALQEYLSVPLWLEYLEFTRHHDLDVAQYTSTGIAKMRALYEKSLTATSLHFTEGVKIWTSYRQFETDLLDHMPDATQEMKAKQIDLIRNLYRRQISVPLSNPARTLKNYVEWEAQQGNPVGDDTDELAGLPANVASAYKKSVQFCSLREPYEEMISKEKPKDSQLLQTFLSYIALEEATGDPARAQVLYERAIADFPITHDLWLKYIDYLEKNLKVSTIILSVYVRAVRNCPWVQSFWSKYLLALERSNSSETDIRKVFEQSLHSGFAFSSPQEYLEHYLTRADVIRRRIVLLKDAAEKPSLLSVLREIFEQAAQFLSTYFPEFLDRSFRLHSYWARLEAHLANDVIAARGVWENLIKGSGWMVEVWKGYIAMELSLGNLMEVRTIYKRAYSRRLEGNGTGVLCEAWLLFEREYGSLEDYDRALSKITPRLAEVKQLQQQQDTKSASTTARDIKEAKQDTATTGKKTRKKDTSASVNDKQANVEKKKRSFEQIDGHPEKNSKKRPKTKASEVVDGVRNINTEEDKVEDTESAHVESQHRETQHETQEHKETQHEKPDLAQKILYTDDCTAFVSQFGSEVTEEELREFFALCGGLKEVRLLKDRVTGKSRGFAYVEFENEQGLIGAISKNRQKLKGYKVKVVQSDPGMNRKKSAVARGSEGHGHHDDDKKVKRGESPNDRSVTDSKRGQGRGGRFSSVSAQHRRGAHVQLSGKNTFALPRAIVRPLGFLGGEANKVEQDELPKSNEEFREMLLKK